MNLKFFKRGDFLLIAVMIFLSLAFLIPKTLSEPEDAKLTAVVMVDGEAVKRISFSEMNNELTYRVPCEKEVWLTVSPDAVWFSESDCPDHTCIRTGKLKRAGDTAACIPNRVIVVIEGAKNTDAPDVITY